MRRCRNFINSTKNIYLKKFKLTNCVALLETGKCRWLNISCCQGDSCSFMQTEEDTKDSLLHWKLRLASISKSEQIRIAAKYCGGIISWK